MPFKGELRGTIPGVTGKSIPGTTGAKMPSIVGAFKTVIPHVDTSAQFREYHRQQIRDVGGRFGGGWGFAWQGLRAVDVASYDHADKIGKAMEKAMKELADEMLAYAKANAPWQDFPGDPARPDRPTENARENLQAVVVKDSDSQWSIYIGHGKNVYYGIWLEVRFGGQYAIILPTVYAFAPQIGDRVLMQTR